MPMIASAICRKISRRCKKLLEMKNKGGADLQAQSAKPAEKPAEAEKAAVAPAAAPARGCQAGRQRGCSCCTGKRKPLPIEPPARYPSCQTGCTAAATPVAEPGMLDSLLQTCCCWAVAWLVWACWVGSVCWPSVANVRRSKIASLPVVI